MEQNLDAAPKDQHAFSPSLPHSSQLVASSCSVTGPHHLLHQLLQPPHKHSPEATQNTAGEFMFLNSYFSQTTSDLGLLKDNSFIFFSTGFMLSPESQVAINSKILLNSFWLIYFHYLVRSSSLQFYLLRYVLLHKSLLFPLMVFHKLNLFFWADPKSICPLSIKILPRNYFQWGLIKAEYSNLYFNLFLVDWTAHIYEVQCWTPVI